MMPTFSILVPVYNHERYIGAALDSLLAQTCPDWEAVVVNDGSTDGTAQVIEAYARRDPRIRVFHKPNGGVSTALNMGLDHAAGEWICWLSSDDLFSPDKLALHEEWFRRDPDCRFFFTHYRTLDDATGAIAEPDLWAPVPETRWQILEMLRCTYIHGNSVCVRRSAFDSVERFDTGLRYAQDYDMWLRLLAKHPAVYIPHRTCVTRVHAQQQTQRFNEALFYDSARAAIGFLNAHQFGELVPAVNLSDPVAAREAVDVTTDVAVSAQGFLYQFGAHPALAGRMLEWFAGGTKAARAVWPWFGVRARAAAVALVGSALESVWKAVGLLASCPGVAGAAYVPTDAEQSIRCHAAVLTAMGHDKTLPYLAYVRRFLPGHALGEDAIRGAPEKGSRLVIGDVRPGESAPCGGDVQVLAGAPSVGMLDGVMRIHMPGGVHRLLALASIPVFAAVTGRDAGRLARAVAVPEGGRKGVMRSACFLLARGVRAATR